MAFSRPGSIVALVAGLVFFLCAAVIKTSLALVVVVPGFATTPPRRAAQSAAALRMSWQPNEDYNSFGGPRKETLTDFEREARQAGATDRKVTIRKPLGLILDEYGNGDVYVKEVVKGGNADAIGGVKPGDVVAMCSATFGGDMWSTRGVGLSRVTRAIEVRSGKTVSLVVQSKNEQKNFLSNLFKNQESAKEQRIREAEKKRAELEAEIKQERKEAAKGWFGLF